LKKHLEVQLKPPPLRNCQTCGAIRTFPINGNIHVRGNEASDSDLRNLRPQKKRETTCRLWSTRPKHLSVLSIQSFPACLTRAPTRRAGLSSATRQILNPGHEYEISGIPEVYDRTAILVFHRLLVHKLPRGFE